MSPRGRRAGCRQLELRSLGSAPQRYIGRLERGESGVTVEALAAILAALDVSLREFFRPFKDVMRPRTPRRRG